MSSVKDEAGQSVVYLCSACQFLCEDLEAVENHRCPGKVVSDTEGGGAELDGNEDVSAVGEGLVAIEQAGVTLEDIALQAAQEALDQEQDQDQDEIPLRRPGEVGGVQTVVWGPIRTRVLIEAVHAFAQSEDPKSTFFWNLVANRVNENLGDGTDFSHMQCQRRWRRLAFTYREAKEKNRLYKFMYGEELAPILETKKPGLFSPKRFVSKTKRVHPATMYRYNFVWDKESLERMVNIYKSEKTLLDVGSCDESQFFKHIAEVLSLDVGEKISGPIVRNKWKKLRSDFREATGQHWTEKDPKFFDELVQFLKRDDADITLTLANTEEFSDSESSDVETVGSTINEWTQRLLLALIRSYAQELANGRDGDSDDIFRNISETLVNEFQIRVNYPLLRDQFQKLEEYYRAHETAEISDKDRQGIAENMEQFFSKLFTENMDFLQKNPLQLVVKTSLGKAKRVDEDKLVKWDRKSTLMLVRLARAHMYILKRGTAVLLFRKVAALMSERGYLMNGHQALGRWKNLARKYHAKATKTNFARLCDFYETKLNGVDEVIEELEDMPVTFTVPSESRPLNSASNSKVVAKSAKRPRRDSNEIEDPDLNNASDPEWTLPDTPKPAASASKKTVPVRRPTSPVAVITISKTTEPADKKQQVSGFVVENSAAGKHVSENGEACRLCGRWDEVLAQIMDDEREARKAELATIKKAVQENTQAIQKLATVLDTLSTALKAVSAKPEVNNLLLEAMVEAEDQYLAEEQNNAENDKAEEFVTISEGQAENFQV